MSDQSGVRTPTREGADAAGSEELREPADFDGDAGPSALDVFFGEEADENEPTSLPAARNGPRRGGLRARRVHRIIRRIDPWSVLKVSFLFLLCVWAIALVSTVLLWGVAVGSGTVENLEGFIARLLAFEEFHFNGDQIFSLFALTGMICVLVGTAALAILAVVFNLIADLVGGIRVTVIEEESARRIVDSA